MSHFDPGSGYNHANPFEPKHIDFETGESQTARRERSSTQSLQARSVSPHPSKKQKKIGETATRALQSSTEATSTASEIALTVLSEGESSSRKPHASSAKSKNTVRLKAVSKSSQKNLAQRIIKALQRKFTYQFGKLSSAEKELLDTLQQELDKMKKPLNNDQISALKEALLKKGGHNIVLLQAIHKLISDNYWMLTAHFENPEDAVRLVCELCKTSPKTADGKMDEDKFTKLWMPTLTKALIPKDSLKKLALKMLKPTAGSILGNLQKLIISSLQTPESKSLFRELVQTLVATGIEKEQAKKYLLSQLLIQCGERIKDIQLEEDRKLAGTGHKNDKAALLETMTSIRTDETANDLELLQKEIAPEFLEALLASIEDEEAA